MSGQARHIYDCDTYGYWCSEEDYDNREKTYGRFIENDEAYEIFGKNTPRPWLNYICNDKIAAVFSNTGLGFFWYKTSLLRITRYEHPVDYQPREFKDGRDVVLEDEDTGKVWNVFTDAEKVRCIHRPGYSVVEAEMNGITVEMTFFVPQKDACECWNVKIKNSGTGKRSLKVKFKQVWTFSKFGIHTAEEGIPYLSTPGKDLDIAVTRNKITAHSTNTDLPVELWGCFYSAEKTEAAVEYDVQKRKDGRIFKFPVCSLSASISIEEGGLKEFHIISGAEEDRNLFDGLLQKYDSADMFDTEITGVKNLWKKLIDAPSCDIPDKNMQKFLNIWLKNQLFTTFRFIRSGYIGYRDTLQDTWGYQLMEPELSRNQILRTLSHMKKDGSCPRNYSPFGFSDKHDLRNTMDSATWIAACISDYIKETGDTGIMDEKIRYLDDEMLYSVEDHIWNAFNLLYEMRGMYGLSLVMDGDWNDAIEGISKSGPAVSVWLTIAAYHGQNTLARLYEFLGMKEKAELLKKRSDVLEKAVNETAWDGEWYWYAVSGKGTPIGSHTNRGGKIHLNSNTWAIFSGMARGERARKAKDAIVKYLDTPVGPALLYPPYELDEPEVGRIVNLEPGTFENGSVYQHAVTFKIFADLALKDYEDAYRTFVNVLPTNPDNFDARRTSEPYCTGNYYCGPLHPRFGQNFFTWFTGNPAWLLRAGFDEILGVKADFEGLLIDPKVPADWNEYSVKRMFRGVEYRIHFKKAARKEEPHIEVNGFRIEGKLIPVVHKSECDVEVYY